MTDDDIVTIFYPIGTATPNQRLIAISTGRSVAVKALREAAEWMDQNGVCMGALCCRALADRTLNGEVTAPAALAQPLEAQADERWQPIETAPKDGTPIVIACIDDDTVFDVYNGHFEVLLEDEDDGPWDIRDGEPWCSYVGRQAGTYFCCWLPGKEWERGWKVPDDFEYTHWMPLPAAPSALSQKAGERG